MEKNKLLLGISIILYIIIIVFHCSNLHNVDLTWNAKHIDKLTDSNGIIEQDLIIIYQRSYLSLWATPMLLSILSVTIILMIKNKGENYD